MSPTETLRLRAVQLELLDILAERCARLGITYYAVFGTALGAVRHQGFIPWDDDVDLAVHRRDLARLLDSFAEDPHPDVFAQHPSTDPGFPLEMMKLRRHHSAFVEEWAVEASGHPGIFIDIFPLDVKPRATAARQLQRLLLRALSLTARIKCRYRTRIPGEERGLGPLLRLLLTPVPIGVLTRAQTRVAAWCAEGNGPFFTVAGSYPYERENGDPSWLGAVARLPFEGDRTVPVFAEVDAYLSDLYGNYWQPPPPAEQVSPHRPVRVALPPEAPRD